MTSEQLVSKVWNYAHVLRDQGISYGDYVEQITYLLFLKMDAEREELLRDKSALPPHWPWQFRRWPLSARRQRHPGRSGKLHPG